MAASYSIGLTGRTVILLGAVLLSVMTTAPYAAIARAEPANVPAERLPPLPLPRAPEPDGVRAAAAALRAACATWPIQRAAIPGPDSARRPPQSSRDDDGGLCTVAANPSSLELTAGLFGGVVTIAGLIVAAGVIGLLRMILVFAWSWRPRRSLAPWA